MTTLRSTLKLAGMAAVSAFAAQTLLRRLRHFHYAGKSVLITGGSRGLGLVLARQLVEAGARVAICARDEAEVHRATTDLRTRGAGDALGFSCDVRDEGQVKKRIDELFAKWKRIDILINVAGIIEVGPLENMTLHDFHNSMQTNCWGALHTTLAVVPYMRQRHWGRIVNIASLGGKRAVPHMLPYAASKFALVGLSNGLRGELAKDGIIVTTICPGLMRTGSARHATFKGQNKKEFSWFSIGDSLPGLSLSAESAAKRILKACQQGDGEVIIAGAGTQVGTTIQKWFPNMTTEVLAFGARLMPAATDSKESFKGSDSSSWLSPSMLTKLSDDAAGRNNEVPRL